MRTSVPLFHSRTRSSLPALAIALAVACGPKPSPEPTATQRDQSPPAEAPTPPAEVPGSEAPTAPEAPAGLPEAAGVHYLEYLTGGAQAGDTLPMIIAIHGLGDSPQGFVGLFEGFDQPARVILPQGLDAYEPGWSWFPVRARDADIEGLAQGIAKAADALAPAVEALTKTYPTAGEPIVTGFSQGGMLSFTLAVRHGELFSAAFPVGGWLPPPLWPQSSPGPDSPPILAFHGDADRAVSFAPTQEAVAALDKLGYEVELRPYPGVGHAIPPAMRAELMAALGEAVTKQAAAAP
ncbi:prolyl oligopeptidase family serine peptidase [Pseudenhygromyxa sp. WMMC2535]|uniref:alpha/beta hydrolase n=1 Tax=Pseudenhygromyxa sp. WMMC2535 TaxID=2712867 RepID=UPI0015527DF9|nr:prolyl oligopeptidase family serine peptidase [Pseudenhygromyxa sp. WMMC2535]NVB42910.1 prolyl oligopeptidase family serine peptidase [Pseudenhygromyxa sp. WMMC2535]